jgi:hypothetical protein
MLQKQLALSDRNIKVGGNNFLTKLYENYSLDRTNSDSIAVLEPPAQKAILYLFLGG